MTTSAMESWFKNADDDAVKTALWSVRELVSIDIPHTDNLLNDINEEIDRRNALHPDACSSCFPSGFDLRYANVSEFHTTDTCDIVEDDLDPMEEFARLAQ